MTDMTPVPTALIEALRNTYAWSDQCQARADIIACLPKPPPTFSDEVSWAFYEALYLDHIYDPRWQDLGRDRLTGLYKAGWLTVTDDGSFIITPPKETPSG